jgi:hypothetical protein
VCVFRWVFWVFLGGFFWVGFLMPTLDSTVLEDAGMLGPVLRIRGFMQDPGSEFFHPGSRLKKMPGYQILDPDPDPHPRI